MGRPKRIVFDFKGLTKKPTLDGEGDLRTGHCQRPVLERKPVVYQDIGGVRKTADGRYRLLGNSRVGFVVAQYDRAWPLVIDPTLVYSTYLHDNSLAWGIVVDAEGNAYVTGDQLHAVFVTKLNPKGDALVYSTFLGGAGEYTSKGIAVDGSGNTLWRVARRATFQRRPARTRDSMAVETRTRSWRN